MTGGPISQALENELRELARQHGIVVWLDRDDVYTEFADDLGQRARDGAFPVPVFGFRRSYLELMLALEPLETGVSMTPLIVHMPGHTEDDMARTPLYELYRAGRRHRRALATLVRETASGRVPGAAIDSFLATPALTLRAADEWLARHGADNPDGDADGPRGPDLSLHSGAALYDALQPGQALARSLTEPGTMAAVWRRARDVLGLDPKSRDDLAGRLGIASGFSGSPGDDAPSAHPVSLASDAGLILAGWAMCTEFVHDLQHAPYDEWLAPLQHLSKAHVTACRQLAAHVRDRYPSGYQRIAGEVEDSLVQSRIHAKAHELGSVDTFRFEDQRILQAALDALGSEHYKGALDWAEGRLDGKSFWASRDVERGIAWQQVAYAARLGLAVQAESDLLRGARSVGEACARYSERGYTVDHAHRVLEQSRNADPAPVIDELAPLRERLNQLRHVYRAWADDQARRFNALCRTEGFLPEPELMQRTLFDQVVKPLTADGPVALFMVDGMRYEMGEQLGRMLSTSSTGAGANPGDVQLDARLAELPTVTEVGMNALAPVADGTRMTVAFTARSSKAPTIAGLRTSEMLVNTPESRRKAMHARVGGDTCPPFKLDKLCEQDVTSLKRGIARARLIVVHSENIDKAGESGVGSSVFERELQRLRAGWRLLREAGVHRFVFTADHGFLLQDRDTRAPRRHGSKTTPRRRHLISNDAIERDREITVSTRDLGYRVHVPRSRSKSSAAVNADINADQARYLVFPDDAAPFDVGQRAKGFVHGGNSLQERVLPVLIVRHRHALGGDTVRYQLHVERSKPVLGMYCLRAKIVQLGQTSLGYSRSQTLELTLSCPGDSRVHAEVRDVRDERGLSRQEGGLVLAPVEHWFELFFRLTGPQESRVQVQLGPPTPSAALAPVVSDGRFDVTIRPAASRPDRSQVATESTTGSVASATARPAAGSTTGGDAWLKDLPDGGVRAVFRHLAAYGSVDEAEATSMLGGPRPYRRFSRRFETYTAYAPFGVRVDMSSGSKRYVRGER